MDLIVELFVYFKFSAWSHLEKGRVQLQFQRQASSRSLSLYSLRVKPRTTCRKIDYTHACQVARDNRWLNFQDDVSKSNFYSKSESLNFFRPKITRLTFHNGGRKQSKQSFWVKIVAFCIFFLFFASLWARLALQPMHVTLQDGGKRELQTRKNWQSKSLGVHFVNGIIDF